MKSLDLVCSWHTRCDPSTVPHCLAWVKPELPTEEVWPGGGGGGLVYEWKSIESPRNASYSFFRKVMWLDSNTGLRHME